MITTKLNKACYIARTIKPFLSINSLKMILHVYFHVVMSYGLIFWVTPSTVRIFLSYKIKWLEFW